MMMTLVSVHIFTNDSGAFSMLIRHASYRIHSQHNAADIFHQLNLPNSRVQLTLARHVQTTARNSTFWPPIFNWGKLDAKSNTNSFHTFEQQRKRENRLWLKGLDVDWAQVQATKQKTYQPVHVTVVGINRFTGEWLYYLDQKRWQGFKSPMNFGKDNHTSKCWDGAEDDAGGGNGVGDENNVYLRPWD